MKLNLQTLTVASAALLGGGAIIAMAEGEAKPAAPVPPPAVAPPDAKPAVAPPGAQPPSAAAGAKPVDTPAAADAAARRLVLPSKPDGKPADSPPPAPEPIPEEEEAAEEREAAFEAAIGRTSATNKDDDFLPPTYPPQRYAGTWGNSPFDREILPPVVEAVKQVNPLDDYKVVGIGKIGGKYLVTIVDKKNVYKTIRSGTPTGEGEIVVEAVTNGTNPQEAMVAIYDGRDRTQIGFDEKRLAAAPKGGVAPKTVPANRNLPGTRRNVPTPRTASTGTNTKSQAKANEALVKHLRQAAGNTPTATTTQASGTAAKPKRRRVVLPPTTNR